MNSPTVRQLDLERGIRRENQKRSHARCPWQKEIAMDAGFKGIRTISSHVSASKAPSKALRNLCGDIDRMQ